MEKILDNITYKDYKPPILCMVIETEGKTTKQLINEVTHRVEDEFNKQIDAYNDKLSLEDYKLLLRKMEIEKLHMLKQFVFQLEHRDEINKRMQEELRGMDKEEVAEPV